MINTVIYDPQIAEDLADRLGVENDIRPTAAHSRLEAEKAVGPAGPSILVIGPGVRKETAFALVEQLSRTHREVGCVLVADRLSTELLQNAVRSGFRDVVRNDASEISAAVRRAFEFIAPAARAGGVMGGKDRPGRVITFFSTKGGVGKTVLAVNTAVGLAGQADKVLLLDLDSQFGDVGVMLGLKPERTIADLIPSIDRLDADMLDGFLARHESGVKVLLAAVQYEESRRPAPDQLEKLFAAARAWAQFIIVDTPASFADHTLAVLDNSDRICLVTTLDVPSVKNTQIALQTLSLLNYPAGKIQVLLNRADSQVSLSPGDVEKHLKHKISARVPSNRLVPRSVNEGRPFLLAEPQSQVSGALKEIVRAVSDESAARTFRKSLRRASLSEV